MKKAYIFLTYILFNLNSTMMDAHANDGFSVAQKSIQEILQDADQGKLVQNDCRLANSVPSGDKIQYLLLCDKGGEVVMRVGNYQKTNEGIAADHFVVINYPQLSIGRTLPPTSLYYVDTRKNEFIDLQQNNNALRFRIETQMRYSMANDMFRLLGFKWHDQQDTKLHSNIIDLLNQFAFDHIPAGRWEQEQERLQAEERDRQRMQEQGQEVMEFLNGKDCGQSLTRINDSEEFPSENFITQANDIMDELEDSFYVPESVDDMMDRDYSDFMKGFKN